MTSGKATPPEREMARLFGRGKWSVPGYPHRGWICIELVDLGTLGEICEMCDWQDIRYVHVMSHSDVDEVLRVGCICAGYMEGDYTRAEEREAAHRNLARRERTWLTKGWRKATTFFNGELRPLREVSTVSKVRVEVFPKHGKRGDGWGARVTDTVTGERIDSRLMYDNPEAVKQASLAVVRRCLRRRTRAR